MSFAGTKGWNTKPKPGVMLNPLYPLSKGLVGCWLFNEGSGSLANDISGKGNHGRLINMSPNVQDSGWGGSKFGGGLQYDGADDYVDCGNDSSLDFTTENFSIEMWINADSYTNNPVLFHKGDYAVSGYYFQISDNKPKFVTNQGGASQQTRSGVNLDTSVWIHLAVIRNGSLVKIYQNGSEVSSYGQQEAHINPLTSANNFLIGQYSSGFNFNGIVDSVRIYNCALSVEEAKQLYYNPFCNLLQVPIRRYSVAAPPVGAIMNQFQRANIGADLYNGVFA